MFSILNELKYRINKDIQYVEERWDDHPNNDYYYAEICGLERALEHVLRAEAGELTELDKWATKLKGKEDYERTSR
tara:strand:+ start:887 stop:1114 length:228 start_codon:yes stop_codon:yes gene_type:complete